MHRHQWGKWETDTMQKSNSHGVTYRVEYWQKRECETCGKIKMRKVATID
jgi:hypothetical protein